jgi:hypothetical protein
MAVWSDKPNATHDFWLALVLPAIVYVTPLLFGLNELMGDLAVRLIRAVRGDRK